MSTETVDRLTAAARECLLAEGYANLSTRRVADRAGVPLSQIHYHFGGKQGLVLALLAAENSRLVGRQESMYAGDQPLSARYDQACDFLDDDLASGYVRVLQEMIAAGWSDRAVADQIGELLRAWFDVLHSTLTEAEQELGGLGPFTAEDVALLVGAAFLGGEAVLLLGDPCWSTSVRRALRRVGDLIRLGEQRR
ncbi:transcriptional regulator, TetR family [Nocardioides terrae]|uniref:Transcriptional regulator, TetR family n=1 Tax=Nocardioides terrae TaxID=574651 RepID=A0A1I1DLI5_9ACTN|nr:TetR/AcrR family transcriptional regulator [Nocardioides terrae]SFB75839.1 transcriptional regulator, TetR family [Nocardioides terrae]